MEPGLLWPVCSGENLVLHAADVGGDSVGLRAPPPPAPLIGRPVEPLFMTDEIGIVAFTGPCFGDDLDTLAGVPDISCVYNYHARCMVVRVRCTAVVGSESSRCFAATNFRFLVFISLLRSAYCHSQLVAALQCGGRLRRTEPALSSAPVAGELFLYK